MAPTQYTPGRISLGFMVAIPSWVQLLGRDHRSIILPPLRHTRGTLPWRLPLKRAGEVECTDCLGCGIVGGGTATQGITTSETVTSAKNRKEDPIAAFQRQSTTSAEHAQLVTKDHDLDLATSIIMIPCGQQTQKLANGKVEKRQQHRHS